MRKAGQQFYIMIATLAVVSSCSQEDRTQSQITLPISADLIITGGMVIHPDLDQPAMREDIAVKDGLILAVGENLAEGISATQIYDASGRYIIPGLTDMHSHFGNGILAPGEDDTSEVLARHLYFGNTTILNLGSSQAWPDRIDDLRAKMNDGSLMGPRLMAVGSLMAMPGSHPVATIYSPELQAQIAGIIEAKGGVENVIDLAPLRATTLVSTPEHVTQEVNRVGGWGADAIKITVESGPDDFGDDHPQMSPAMIAASVETAKAYDIPVLCHISSLDELEACLANGADAVVHVVTSGVDERAPEDLEARMAAAGFVVIPTAAMFEGWGRYTTDPSLLDQLQSMGMLSESEYALFSSDRMMGIFRPDEAWAGEIMRVGAHLKKFYDLGGMIVAGTDTGNPYRFAGLALHEEIAFYVKSGLSPREALMTATGNAARFMGREDQWGAIKLGLAADMIVLNANPLDDIKNTLAIADVIQAGRVIDRGALPLH